MEETLVGVKKTEEFASRFLSTLTPAKNGATLVGLSGDLGSGKTTFVKYLAKALHVEEEIVSPTFILAKYYTLSGQKWKQMIHIDGYRLDVPDEIGVLKWEDMLADNNNLVFFEWPERIAERFPSTAKMLRFTFIDEQTRNVEVS